MLAKNPGRYLAPVAIVAVIVAVALIVRARVSTQHATASPPVHQLPASRHATSGSRSRSRSRHVFYVIQAGDSLSTISVKTGVPIATLEALNPSIDPNALQAGQRLRLRH